MATSTSMCVSLLVNDRTQRVHSRMLPSVLPRMVGAQLCKRFRTCVVRAQLLSVVENFVRPATSQQAVSIGAMPRTRCERQGTATLATHCAAESDVLMGCSLPDSGIAASKHSTKPEPSSAYT